MFKTAIYNQKLAKVDAAVFVYLPKEVPVNMGKTTVM